MTMINQQLLDYIKSQTQLGLNRDTISQLLIGQGWTVSDIDAAFASLSGLSVPMPVPPPVPAMSPVAASLNSQDQNNPQPDRHKPVKNLAMLIGAVVLGACVFFGYNLWKNTDGTPRQYTTSVYDVALPNYFVFASTTHPDPGSSVDIFRTINRAQPWTINIDDTNVPELRNLNISDSDIVGLLMKRLVSDTTVIHPSQLSTTTAIIDGVTAAIVTYNYTATSTSQDQASQFALFYKGNDILGIGIAAPAADFKESVAPIIPAIYSSFKTTSTSTQAVKTDPTTFSGAASTSIDTSNWQSYSNPQLGYSVKYPPLNDKQTLNRPSETLIYGDPQEVGFQYSDSVASSGTSITFDKYTSTSTCQSFYSGLNQAHQITIGNISYYYADNGGAGLLSDGAQLFQAEYLTFPGSFPDESCLHVTSMTVNNDGSKVTAAESQQALDTVYAMLSSLSLSPATAAATVSQTSGSTGGQVDCGNTTYPDFQTQTTAMSNSKCFNDTFKMCTYSTMTGIVGNRITTYAVIKPKGNLCEVNLTSMIISSPEGASSWDCFFDPSQPFLTSNDAIERYCTPQ